ncbi:MAG: hypothetical protein IK018_07505 [Lachnospiraceae bacterium]|nr:hypothetical protein [Lachnospiraceae bacterium]MBR5993636.1 hypothetical protein [Lachnospiraceae bacterium]
MASSMIHYIVSHLIADRLKVKDLNMFLLGSVIAPDTGNKEDGSYCKLHYMDIRGDIALKGFNWVSFADEHKDSMEEDYYKGYCCHLIMDALWFHDVCDKYIRHLPKDIKSEKIQAMYRDYWRLNHLLLKEYNIPADSISVADIPDESIDNASLLKMADTFAEQLQAPECNLNELEVLTWDIVTDYLEEAKNLCLREMTAISNGCGGMNPTDLFVPTIN